MKSKVIKFGASWCGPCRVLESNLKDFDKCEIERYDVDDADEDLLIKYNVRSVPTVVIVDENGNEQHKFVGLFKVSDLEKKVDELMSK